MHRLIFVFSLVLLSVSFGMPKEPAESVVNLPLVPDYPADGKIPASQSDRFVFLDRKTGELEFSFPKNLGDTDYKSHPAPRITKRAPLAINTQPYLLVTVKAGGDRVFNYEYKLENRVGARQEIVRWLLELPNLQNIESVEGPTGWISNSWEMRYDLEANYLANMTGDLGSAQLERIKKDIIKKRVDWDATDDPIPAGSVQDQFRIKSQNKPGIVTAYFQGSPSMPVLYHHFPGGETPPELGGELNVFNFVENNSRSMPTLGPKFRPTVSPQAVAQDFFIEINRLTKEGMLSPGSGFTKEVLSFLSALVQQYGGNSNVSLTNLEQKPTTGLEHEIYQAIKLSIGGEPK